MVFFQKAPVISICFLALFLLVAVRATDVSAAKPRGAPFILATYARTRGTVPKLTSAYNHKTNLLQTAGFRRPPSGPNPEGNFEVNALSKNTDKHGAKVQNVERSGTASMSRKDLPASAKGEV